MSDTEPSDWPNPFWVRELSITSPMDVEGCARRLEPLGGNPNWFQSDFTSGWVTRRDFRLAGRFGHRGIHHAVVVARGTLRASGDTTRVDLRVRYAAGPLLWFVSIAGFVLWARSDASWTIIFGCLFLAGWIGLLWFTHRIADLLVKTIVFALGADSNAADPRSGRRSRTVREVLIGDP